VFWAFSAFVERDFAICGKTVTALKRNIIHPLITQLEELGFSVAIRRSENYMDVTLQGRTNRFYFFGGRDESSASLIQGMTLCGVLLDEVALMPRSFVEQALARCSVEGSRFWFNCNPGHPHHWFYTEWIQKQKEKNVLYLHFTMDDNPSLSDEVKNRYETLYSGAFYDRFILGKWVAAEGLVYPFFSREQHVCLPPDFCTDYYISCDYGTVNPASFGLWGRKGDTWYRICEYYYSSKREGGQKTDEEYYTALENLAGSFSVSAVVCDPSAASFMTCIRRHGRFRVIPAKNNVTDGIRQVANALREGIIKISPECSDTIREFALYRWDDGAVKDQPIKENDHAMDDIRYFVATILEGGEDELFVLAAHR
jgi:PBSX family phage terminase large subunit